MHVILEISIFISIFTFIADRAKQIKTTASVNEDPTEKLIRNLKEENDRLKEMLEKANAGEKVGRIDEKQDDDDDDDDDNEGLSEEGIVSARSFFLN